MKIFLSLLLSGLVAAMAIGQQDSQATVASNNLGTAVEKANFKMVEDAVSPDAVIYWIHAKFKNRDAFEKYLHGQFTSSDQRNLAFNEDGNAEDDTISASWGTFNFQYGKSGDSLSNRLIGRYSTVAQKVNGTWQIVSMHLSLPYPPNQGATIN